MRLSTIAHAITEIRSGVRQIRSGQAFSARGYVVAALVGVVVALAVTQVRAFAGGSLVTGDSSSLFPTTPRICANPVQSTVALTVAGGAVNIPATAAAGRRFITVNYSQENTSGGKIKCRIDGTTPVMGLGNAGDLLTSSSGALPYNVSASTAVQCITDTTTTYVIATECR